MPSTTPKGFPYPLPTDPLSAGAEAIHSLASAVDARWPMPAVTLPASPADGQEAILVDNVATPAYAWTFKWIAAASRWLFIGGAPWIGAVDAAETRSGTGTFGDLTTVLPTTFTAPRAGTYQMQWGCQSFLNASNASNYMGVNIGGVLPVVNTPTSLLIVHNASQNAPTELASPWRTFAGIAASAVIKPQYHDGGGSSSFSLRRLAILPVSLT